MQGRKTGKVGRPPTGITRPKVSVSLPRNLTAKAREIAAGRNMTFSDFVEEAVRQEILRTILQDEPLAAPKSKEKIVPISMAT